jgi:hypothetical protein
MAKCASSCAWSPVGVGFAAVPRPFCFQAYVGYCPTALGHDPTSTIIILLVGEIHWVFTSFVKSQPPLKENPYVQLIPRLPCLGWGMKAGSWTGFLPAVLKRGMRQTFAHPLRWRPCFGLQSNPLCKDIPQLNIRRFCFGRLPSNVMEGDYGGTKATPMGIDSRCNR